MKNTALKFEDFQVEKLTKNQQKTIQGGDGDPNDPGKAGGKGNGLITL